VIDFSTGYPRARVRTKNSRGIFICGPAKVYGRWRGVLGKNWREMKCHFWLAFFAIWGPVWSSGLGVRPRPEGIRWVLGCGKKGGGEKSHFCFEKIAIWELVVENGLACPPAARAPKRGRLLALSYNFLIRISAFKNRHSFKVLAAITAIFVDTIGSPAIL
jgi:hypothetical protein